MRMMRTNRLIILLVLLTGTSIAVAGPVGTWDGTFDSGNYGDNGTITDWLLRNDNTTDGQWRLQTTSLGVVSFNPSGQYTFQNNQLNFSISGTASESRYGTTSSYTLVVNGTINGNWTKPLRGRNFIDNIVNL